MQERAKIVEVLNRIKTAVSSRLEEKSVQGNNRLGEEIPDVTISPDYNKINNETEQVLVESADGE